jgi:hypothetical protein
MKIRENSPFFRYAHWQNGVYLPFQFTSIHLSISGVNAFAVANVPCSGHKFEKNLNRRHNKIHERIFRGERISSKLPKMPGPNIFGNTGVLVGLLGYTELPSPFARNSDGFP